MTFGGRIGLLGGCAVALAVAGCSFGSAPTDRWIQVQFFAPGFSPQEAENSIAQPAEQLLLGIAGVRSVESVCRSGEVLVWLRIDRKADLPAVRIQVAQRLQPATWPVEMLEPRLASASTAPLLLVALQSESSDARLLRATAQHLKQQLLLIPGTSEVLRYPLAEKIEIHVDEERLRSLALTIDEVALAVQQSYGPVELALGDSETVVRGGSSSGLDELASLLLVTREDGSAVRLADVAKVQLGEPDHFRELVPEALDWPRGSVVLGIQCDSAAAAAECSRAIDAAFSRSQLPAEVTVTRALGEKQATMLPALARFWEPRLPPGSRWQHTLTAEGHSQLTPAADVCCRIMGPDLDELRRISGEVAKQVRASENIADTRLYGGAQEARMHIELDADRAAQLGIEPEQLKRIVYPPFETRPLARTVLDGIPTEIVLRGPSLPDGPSVRGASGELIPLAQLARITQVAGPKEIWRYDAQRCVLVQVTAHPDARSLRNELQRSLQSIQDRIQPPYQLRMGD